MTPAWLTRRRLLLPLAPLYATGQQLQERVEASRRRPRLELPGVTLSVGSLSTGGAGKTPVVAELGRLLSDRGYAVRVLSRGYRRSGSGVERVDPGGEAQRFGDEPMLLARQGLPVYVGADRYAAGLLATRQLPEAEAAPVFLMDDGFQHRRVARDLDIVLLTSRDLQDLPLPAGDLREPLSALRRAEAIVVREDEAESLSRYVEVLLRDRWAETLVWTVRRSLHLPTGGSRPLVFCGLARPEGFLAMVRQKQVEPAGVVRFRDHQRYHPGVTRRLLLAARKAGADCFLTTEKDAVKLSAEMQEVLSAVGPVGVATLETRFLDERRMLEQLIGTVGKLNRRRGRR